MPEIKFYNRAPVPMEMHKVKIVQKLTLLPEENDSISLKKQVLIRFCFTTAISLWICSPIRV